MGRLLPYLLTGLFVVAVAAVFAYFFAKNAREQDVQQRTDRQEHDSQRLQRDLDRMRYGIPP